MYFDREEVLSEVYKKIRTIEMNRQSLGKKNFSQEDLHRPKTNSFTAGERKTKQCIPIIAEIDMVNMHTSDGSKGKIRKAHRIQNRASSHGKRHQKRNNEEGFTCRLF